jgi:ring-1,2-phenylacetyl-CoA epoxidase subunit PaaE
MTTVASAAVTGRSGLAFHPLTVAAVDPLCEDAAAVTFVVPDELAAAYSFCAGQSVTLRRVVDGVEHRRTYSICAPVGDPLRIGVREVPEGLFSCWLTRQVLPGMQIEVSTPTGSWQADPALGERHLCIAAGSGITPLLSILSTVLTDPRAQVSLLFGNRTSRTVMFAEDLADLKNRYGPRLQVAHVLSREPREVELFSGRLNPERLRRLLTELVPVEVFDHVWLCGPLDLAEPARRLLVQLGVPTERVHVELFYIDAPPPQPRRGSGEGAVGATSELTTVVDGLRATAAVSQGSTLLGGAQATRSDLPFACKGGVCGTCRALVREGQVDMRRNYALEPAEVVAGFVLTCQTFPVSDQVTVDYDA